MKLSIWDDKKIMVFSLAAAGTTVVAGMLHLIMAPVQLSRNFGEGILFLFGGILQVFWAVPVMKRWGRIWQIIGIVGTAVFVVLFFSDRFHLLPEGNILGGGSSGNIRPEDFSRGNHTAGEFSRGNFTSVDFARSNLPRGIGFGLNGNSLTIEVCQIVFIGLYAILTKIYPKRQPKKTDAK